MTGGLQQYSRVLRTIRSDIDDRDARKILDRAEQQLAPPQIVPAEDLQAGLDDAGAVPDRLPGWAWFAFAIALAALAAHHALWSASL
jgi:hypothetical protein